MIHIWSWLLLVLPVLDFDLLGVDGNLQTLVLILFIAEETYAFFFARNCQLLQESCKLSIPCNGDTNIQLLN